MIYSHIMSAAVGAVLVALIYQVLIIPRVQGPARPGQAMLDLPSAVAQAARPSMAAVAQPAGSTGELQALRAELQARGEEVGRLKEEVGRLRNQGAESQQQLEAVVGRPQGWPAGLPQGYNAEVLEPRLQQFLERSGLGSLADIDCTEFPCVAVIETKAPGADFGAKLQSGLREFMQGGDLGQRVASAIFNGPPRGDSRLTAITLAPAERYDPDLQRRTNHRAESIMANLQSGPGKP